MQPGWTAIAAADLPQFVRDMLASPPRHGEGVHRWLYRVSRQLHAHRGENDICHLLKATITDCGRPVPENEILAAVRNSKMTAWQQGHTHIPAALGGTRQWPECDQEFRVRLINDVGYGLYELWEQSPVRLSNDDDQAAATVPVLFKPGELICVGRDKFNPVTELLCELADRLATFQFIVPSPMRARVGTNQAGKPSVRCLDNTGSRRYIVTEFDSGTLDEQAAVLVYLGALAPLALVVFSGSRSLQGWFVTKGIANLEEFFALACRVGADSMIWPRCQFIRMPGGTRSGGARQMVYWFNPEGTHHG